MLQHRRFRTGLILLLALGLAACASGKKQYEMSLQLQERGQYREAMAILEEAIAAEPRNETYREALSKLRNALILDILAEGDTILGSQTPPTMSAITRARVRLTEARKIDPDHAAVIEFSNRLEQETQSLMQAVEKDYQRARDNISAGQWLEAHANLQNIQERFPDFRDTRRLVQEVSDQGVQSLHAKGKQQFEQEEYRKAVDYLQSALTLDPEHDPSQKLLAAARERDSKEYFVNQAEKAVLVQDWALAIRRYEKAQEYDPADANLKQAVINVNTKAAFYFMRETRSHLYAGWLGKAFQSYNRATDYAAASGDSEFSGYLQALATELSAKTAVAAEQFSAQSHFGSAWYWYQKIKNIDSNYPEIFYRIQSVEDKVIQRVKKSIAVFDFDPPNKAPDAGSIFANSLSTYLFKSASKDIKILERENLKSILEEMKLGQIGVVSSNAPQEVGRIYGIDVAVMGSVLRYNVDSTSYSDTKSVTYQVKKTEENIDYLNWKTLHPDPTKEELAAAPMPYVYKMQDVEKQYNVSTHKKVAFVTVSFRIVDVNTGENILVDTIQRSKTAMDETSAGVEVAGIKYDPLEMPTDTELLQELTGEVVAELGRETLRPLKNLEKTYYELGEIYLERREPVQAAEQFVNTVFNAKIKAIQNPSLTLNARNRLDSIFLEYKFQLVP
jgi:curli biogenesis system outer membrane secretion channel CsgG